MTVRRFVIGASMFAGLGLCAALAAQSKAVIWPAADIKWTPNPGVAGAQQAVLWGDPTKGAYGAMKQVPGGTVLAMHTHKQPAHVIVIKGTIAFEIEGKTGDMTVGSYVMIPGGVPHAATCKGTTACQYFEEMPGAFDSAAVPAPAKK